MKEFDKYLEQLKGGLKDFLTPEMSKEDIDKITSLSSIIDHIEQDYQSMTNDYDDLKSDYIKIAKNQHFKRSDNEETLDDKSDDEIINEILGL